MMIKLERLHAILIALQSKKVVRAQDLATRFGVSLRTIYRDIKALEGSGVPIGAEAGIGYFIAPGFYLPPVMFTHEEASALLMAGKFMEIHTDPITYTSFNNALTKIKAVLDVNKRDEIEGLENSIRVNSLMHNDLKGHDLNIGIIKQSLIANKVLQMEYGAKNQDVTLRSVEPIGLNFYYGKWHLIAYCQKRSSYRDFRLDRIKKIKILDITYKKENHPSLQEYINKMVEESEVTHVIIQVPNKVSQCIENDKYYLGFLKERSVGDKMELQFAVDFLPYFARWVVSLGSGVKIIRPVELVYLIDNHIKEILNNDYSPSIQETHFWKK